MKMKKMFSTSYIDHSPILKKRTCLSSRSSSLKFCFRFMRTSRNLRNLPKENYTKPRVNRIIVHSYATRSQISKTLYKTNTRIGFEENPQKKAFGIPSTKIFQEKNHFCASFGDDPFVSFTSSKGKNGIAGVHHEIVAPGQIFQKKNSSKHFIFKPQMIYKTPLKNSCVVRTKYTAAECKKIYIKNLQIALRMKQIKRQHPEFYEQHQKLFKEFFKDAKKLDNALLD